MNIDLHMLSERLLASLCSGAYQGGVLTLFFVAALKAMPRANAVSRHAAMFSMLLIVAALPIVHFAGANTRSAESQNAYGETESGAVGGSAAEAGVVAGAASADPIAMEEPQASLFSESEGRVPEEVWSGTGIVETFDRGELEEATAAAPTFGDEAEHAEAITEMPPTTHTRGWHERMERLGTMIPDWQLRLPSGAGLVLAGLWLLIAFGRLAGLVWQYWQLNGLKARSSGSDGALLEVFRQLCSEMSLRRSPVLLTSREIDTPIVAGFWRPAVLIPARLASLDPSHLGQILRHELAHVARWDDWMNLVQQVIRSVLFFDPAVWWLSRRLSVEREIACDDYVLSAETAPRAYALLLTEFASGKRARRWTAAPAGWNKRSELEERITMILDSKRNSSTRPGRVSVGLLTISAAIVAALGLYGLPRVALAQSSAASEGASDELTLNGPAAPRSAAAVNVEIVPPAPGTPPTANLVITAPADVTVPMTLDLDVPGGPRLKGSVTATQVPVHVLPPPHPPAVPVAPAPMPGMAPLPPQRPQVRRAAAEIERRRSDSSEQMERRLDRLERMVERLIDQNERMTDRESGAANPYFNNPWKPAAPGGKNPAARLHEHPKNLPRPDDLARTHGGAKNPLDAAREAERAAIELRRHHIESSHDRLHLSVLQATRDSLQKQVEALEKQIAELEQREREASDSLGDGEEVTPRSAAPEETKRKTVW